MRQALTATNDFVVKFANVNGSGSASAQPNYFQYILLTFASVFSIVSNAKVLGDAFKGKWKR